MITSENYIENVLRTDAIYDEELKQRLCNNARLLHAAIGLATESGEFLDALKKHIFYGKPLDKVNAIEEQGDSLWYIGLALDELATTMNDVLTQNINKLKLRYPNKFNGKDAIERNIEAERNLLEHGFEPPYSIDKNICFSDIDSLHYNDRIIFKSETTGETQTTQLPLVPKMPEYSNRGKDWLLFSMQVLNHIENYTVPQYGDAPDDQIEKYSIETCLTQVEKYINRYGKVSEDRQNRDFLKMAHYVQTACLKHANLMAEQQHS